MYESICGNISNLQPTTVVIETSGGIGYILNISLNTYTTIQGKEKTRLFTHLVVREDAWTLFGFADEVERELFRLLISVSGVGAMTARIVLSSYTPAELESIIANGDVKKLKAVKGIGGKTAERIIVDLRDKINQTSAGAITGLPMTKRIDDFDEALAALTMLGFARAQSQKVLNAIYDADPGTPLEAAIKKSLSML